MKMTQHRSHAGRSAESEVPALAGGRMRKRREERGLSIRALARRIGVSPSLVSQIETGKANPSVGTLLAISTELGLSLDELFLDLPGQGRNGGAAAEGGRRGPVLRERARASIDLATGVHWSRLTPTGDSEVDFLYAVYEPGGASCPPDALMRHHGREYGLVLAGRLGATIGFESYELEPGDSVVLNADTPHRFWTIGEQAVTVVWTIVGRAGDLLGEFDPGA